ncbi:hypothetical protein C8R43DRAFT_909704, partial [Mycena crocata]
MTPAQLHKSFKARLNPPDVVPEQFDADLQEIINGLADTIPFRTKDQTPQGFFLRLVVEDDIKQMKLKPRSRLFCSAHGIDVVLYSKILTIPNSVLVELFNTCLVKCDAPQHWLVMLLVGILKQGLRQWSDANNVVSNSQSGFRPGRRTEDNGFLLIGAVAQARAEGKPLYVFYGDMTNAFPYTDMNRLWVDMYRAGVGGRFFD